MRDGVRRGEGKAKPSRVLHRIRFTHLHHNLNVKRETNKAKKNTQTHTQTRSTGLLLIVAGAGGRETSKRDGSNKYFKTHIQT